MNNSIRIHPIRLAPFKPFKIARREEWVVENFILEIEMDGIVAYGEAAPDAYYGDTLEKVMADLQYFQTYWSPAIPKDHEKIAKTWRDLLPQIKTRSALNAIDTALWDLMGKSQNVALFQQLGITPAPIKTSSTIGMDDLDTMLAKCEQIKDHPIIKIKVGSAEDVKILEAIRNIYKGDIRVDANCGWQTEELVDLSFKMKELNVEFIEQPLQPEQDQFIREHKDEFAVPIIADESCVTPEDVDHCANCFHGINIKLVKCGGITPALQMLERARHLGIKVMVGGMLETNVAVAASTLVGAQADFADLDGSWLLKDDPFSGHQLKNGIINLTNRPGLGVLLHQDLTELRNPEFD